MSSECRHVKRGVISRSNVWCHSSQKIQLFLVSTLVAFSLVFVFVCLQPMPWCPLLPLASVFIWRFHYAFFLQWLQIQIQILYCISTRSHLCVIAPFLKVVPGIYQNYCINTHPLVSFALLVTASRFMCQLQTERLSEKGPSPSLAPLSGTVSPLTFAP